MSAVAWPYVKPFELTVIIAKLPQRHAPRALAIHKKEIQPSIRLSVFLPEVALLILIMLDLKIQCERRIEGDKHVSILREEGNHLILPTPARNDLNDHRSSS